MANWKKIIVSGSAAELSQLNVGANQQISSSANDTFLSGSFSGSFFGDGAGLSGVAASFPVTEKTDLATADKFFINDGASKYVTYGNLLTDLAGTNLAVEGTDSLTLASSITGITATGSFSGSFTGDGSGLSGLATTLTISGSTAGTTVALGSQTLTIAGTANEIESVATAQTITIGLPNDVTIGNDLTVTNDVLVSGNTTIEGNLNVNGTTTTISSSNLLVSDKFAMFASGSTSAVDGGIIVQSDVTGTGLAVGYDASADRWALQNGLSGTATAIVPDAYLVSATSSAAANLPANPDYGGASNGFGNIFVANDTGDVYIYS